VSAEKMLINLIQRAKDLKIRGANFPISEEFDYLLGNEHTLQDFQSNPDLLKIFLELDDLDLWGAIKLWKKSDDYVLRSISRMFLTRNLFKISLKNDPFTKKEIESSKRKAIQKLGIPEEDLDYFFSHGTVSNYGYLIKDRINILTKKGKVIDVAQAADLPNIKVMSKIVEKHYICKAKSLI
jgi:hypothetical protein|tara:strand:- start:82 stop:627 length:546 start_codon:yes stop_codon:yes gene_type:complete